MPLSHKLFGHEVTLFASGDSQTRAELVSCAETALRLNPAVRDTIPYHMVMLDRVRRRAAEFDVLHFHIDLLQFPVIRGFAGKTLTTLHGPPRLARFAAVLCRLPEGADLIDLLSPTPAGHTKVKSTVRYLDIEVE